MRRPRLSFRLVFLLLGAFTVVLMTVPSEAAAQSARRGSVHAAGKPGRTGKKAVRRTPHGGTVHHTHHVVHHRVHPWARRGPTIWAWHPVGWFVATLATTAIIVSIVDDSGGETSSGNVYYDEGVYYEKTEDGYKVIPPPEGAKISSLPEGYTSVEAGGRDYGYYQGDFYVEGADGEYVVTSAPVGAIVPYIPDAAEEREGAGGTTYTYNGVTYQPVSLNGDTSYVVSSTS